jgi:LmbE family N-acetylglucosaminyl deacetylase
LMPAPAWIGDGRNVLVVAPHPDDDVIGCGGTLHGLALAGIQPTVMYVTDGRASHPHSLRFPASRLVSLRQLEARAALKELGISTQPIFLRVHDGTLSAIEPARRQWLVDEMSRAIRELDIDTVLGPWPHDPHSDHVATARSIRTAVRSTSKQPRVVHYVIWAGIRSSEKRLQKLAALNAFEVGLEADQVDAKRRALLRHRTQTSTLIDDDPQGFRIDETLMNEWLRPVEVFYESQTQGNASEQRSRR